LLGFETGLNYCQAILPTKVASAPRVGFFTDTYTEINGVALTSRELTAFATRREYPFLCVRGAADDAGLQDASTTHIELRRGRLAFGLDKGLWHDPLLWRHERRISAALREFRPDIIHVVSPGDVSEIGVYLAKKMKLPLAISWHTNLHEFGAMRLAKLLKWAGQGVRTAASSVSEHWILEAMVAFYRMGDVLYAPNDALVEMLEKRTGKPVFLMKRGIDTGLFTPARRTVRDDLLRIGFVGRTTPEKNVRFLRDIEAALLKDASVPPFGFLIAGDGSEREWLKQNLACAQVLGILRGEALAEAYANMDVFAFPSRTDTFGNVVLEAFASGVPAVVTDAGGPKFIVRNGESGFVAGTDEQFVTHAGALLRDEKLRACMGAKARTQALGESWDAVFEKVYDGYRVGIASRTGAGRCAR
jgi:glycosyltransferase involved in cell wall biosynthesis